MSTNLDQIDKEIATVLADPSTSTWLKEALNSALSRDILDASRDADFLARLLDRRLATVLPPPQ